MGFWQNNGNHSFPHSNRLQKPTPPPQSRLHFRFPLNLHQWINEHMEQRRPLRRCAVWASPSENAEEGLVLQNRAPGFGRLFAGQFYLVGKGDSFPTVASIPPM